MSTQSPLQSKVNGHVLSDALVDRMERRLTRPAKKATSTRLMGSVVTFMKDLLEDFEIDDDTPLALLLAYPCLILVTPGVVLVLGYLLPLLVVVGLAVAILLFLAGIGLAVGEVIFGALLRKLGLDKRHRRKRRKRAAVWHEYTV